MLNKVTKNIWPILLEKAYAKFNGSYEDIVSGISEEIKFFLPYPIQNYTNHFDEDQKGKQWNRIKINLNNYCLLTGNTFSENPNDGYSYEDVGLAK